MNPAHTMTTADDNNPALTLTLRWIASLMQLWGLCARAACRRARTCRGEPRDCLCRYAGMVPEEARDGVKAMFDGIQNGTEFDALLAGVPAVEALVEWAERVEASMRSDRRPDRGGAQTTGGGGVPAAGSVSPAPPQPQIRQR